jgi:hypothetical protein
VCVCLFPSWTGKCRRNWLRLVRRSLSMGWIYYPCSWTIVILPPTTYLYANQLSCSWTIVIQRSLKAQSQVNNNHQQHGFALWLHAWLSCCCNSVCTLCLCFVCWNYMHVFCKFSHFQLGAAHRTIIYNPHSFASPFAFSHLLPSWSTQQHIFLFLKFTPTTRQIVVFIWFDAFLWSISSKLKY